MTARTKTQRPATRVTDVISVVVNELNNRSVSVEHSDLLAVTIIIRIDQKTGKPHRVLFRPEFEGDAST